MEPLKTTTARLRRTFAYPTDDSSAASDSPPEALDEEEQESLIATLSSQNETRNAQFRRLLFALPALSSVPYLISLLTLSRAQSSLLALTSLASTAWLLYYLPPAETGIPYLDELGGGGGGLSAGGPAVTGGVLSPEDEDEDDAALRRSHHRRRRRASSFSVARQAGFHRTPLETWLPYLNLGLCGVLFVIGILRSAKNGKSQSLVGDLLPGVVYAVVLAAKMVMGGVDPESELGGLRYEYKGA
jgi:hypothetical protein